MSREFGVDLWFARYRLENLGTEKFFCSLYKYVCIDIALR